MNLREFYVLNDNNLLESFEDSEFTVGIDNYIGDVVKALIIAFTNDENDESSEVPKQLATGGIAKRTTKEKANDKEQKWSFCSEIQTMSKSLIALIGFDIAKHLFILVGIKQIIQNMINDLLKVDRWAKFIPLVATIKNAFMLDDCDPDKENDCITVLETFDVQKYLDNPDKVCDDGTPICQYYLASKSSKAVKEVLFTYIDNYIADRSKNKSETFVQVRNYVGEIFNDLLLHTALNDYNIHSVNQLVVSLGDYDVCYSPSFIKCFEVNYKESFGDMPESMRADYKVHHDIIEQFINPTINDITSNATKSVKKIDLTKLGEKLLIYFHLIFNNVKTNSVEALHNNTLNVVCDERFFEEIVDVTEYTLVQIAKNISSQIITSKYFGESTRIQFIHFFNGVLSCSPHCELFNIFQRNALYWTLCPKKAIEKSLLALQE